MMKRFWLAWRTFWAVWLDPEAAERVRRVLENRKEGASSSPSVAPQQHPQQSTPTAPLKSHEFRQHPAITLLATLQREARLIDFLQEDLTGYSDAQIGAAVREIHRDCRAALQRMFDIHPVIHEPEGSCIPIPHEHNPGVIRLTGAGSAGKQHGVVRHHGWQASRCEIPQYTGPEAAAHIIVPADLEVT